MTVLNAVPKKFKEGDEAYYLDNGKIQTLTITGFDAVVDEMPFYPNTDYNIIGWNYRTDYKKMACMDNFYAPVTVSLGEDVLFKTKEELIESVRE